MEARKINWRSRVRLVDEVADELRERIYAGDYAMGAKLRQEQLACDLQVSRTPLREALRVLEREGLLHAEPGRGVCVAPADPARFIAAFQLREVVDGLAARLAAGHPDRSAREALYARIEQQQAALQPWSPGDYTRANVAFHIDVLKLSDNQYVAAEAPLVRMTSQVFTPVALLEPSRATQAVQQHRALAAAIVDGDSRTAERLARAHIRATIEQIAKHTATNQNSAASPVGRARH